MQRAYNIPMIVNYVDNIGNESQLVGVSDDINSRFIDWRRVGKGDLYTEDILRAEIEIDPSFSEEEYDVYWFIALTGYSRQRGNTASLQIKNEHVGEQVELRFQVISKKDWHRHYGLDDSLCLIFRVLPPE